MIYGIRLPAAALALCAVLSLAACSPAATSTTEPAPAESASTDAPAAASTDAPAAAAPCTTPDKVTLQLKWDTQAQFAGYYAAQEQDYADACLEVTLLNGGPEIYPEEVVARGDAEFGLTWQPSLLAFREKGTLVQTIAQVFQSSGMREISWKETGIESPADLRGKNVAVWLGGNEYELFATLAKYQLDREKDLTIVAQPFDMQLLLDKQVDAAAAMTYNELAQVLETQNPATGELYTIDDLNIIDFNQEGTAMLEDGIFVSEDWIKDPQNQDIAVRFLRASIKGWIRCRENPEACVDAVMALGPTSGRGHQAWQMNEINKLVWPAPDGIGIMDAQLWQQTADIALQNSVITQSADPAAYSNTYIQQALDGLGELDTTGLSWTPAVVPLTEGGQ
jgi:NitT/TauT family transport system substrate-binding protein